VTEWIKKMTSCLPTSAKATQEAKYVALETSETKAAQEAAQETSETKATQEAAQETKATQEAAQQTAQETKATQEAAQQTAPETKPELTEWAESSEWVSEWVPEWPESSDSQEVSDAQQTKPEAKALDADLCGQNYEFSSPDGVYREWAEILERHPEVRAGLDTAQVVHVPWLSGAPPEPLELVKYEREMLNPLDRYAETEGQQMADLSISQFNRPGWQQQPIRQQLPEQLQSAGQQQPALEAPSRSPDWKIRIKRALKEQEECRHLSAEGWKQKIIQVFEDPASSVISPVKVSPASSFVSPVKYLHIP